MTKPLLEPLTLEGTHNINPFWAFFFFLIFACQDECLLDQLQVECKGQQAETSGQLRKQNRSNFERGKNSAS